MAMRKLQREAGCKKVSIGSVHAGDKYISDVGDEYTVESIYPADGNHYMLEVSYCGADGMVCRTPIVKHKMRTLAVVMSTKAAK